MPVNVIDKAHQLLERGHDVVIATIESTQGSSPRHAGATMAFDAQGRHWGSVGGGSLEAAVMNVVPEVFRSSVKSQLLHFALREGGEDALGMACGGEAVVRVVHYSADNPDELCVPPMDSQTAYVFGCGHIGLALCPVLTSIDFKVTMVDDRPEYADPSLFPQADAVLTADSYEHAFDVVRPGPNAYVIIVTYGHRGDYAVLRQAVRSDCAYLGMIGSRRKIALLFEMLRKEGVPDERIARVYAPIGEAIHAETPEEIAVSIAAELIRVRSGYGSR